MLRTEDVPVVSKLLRPNFVLVIMLLPRFCTAGGNSLQWREWERRFFQVYQKLGHDLETS